MEQFSYGIIFIELGTIQKIPLAGWRLFYFHQQIHVHVTSPHHIMSYHVILCHVSDMYSEFIQCEGPVVMYQTCIQSLSSVKGLLMYTFIEWHGAYAYPFF